MVRDRAARSLARKEGVHVPVLREMLRSSGRAARYGACSALQHLGAESRPAVGDLIACLESEDRVLRRHAIKALGTTDDMEAVTALFRMAAREFPGDRYDIVRRYIADALFGPRDSLVEKSRTLTDRKLLLAATRRFLQSITGHCRTAIAQNAAQTLSFAEVKALWPELDAACNTTATTYNTAINMTTLQLMARYHIEEGVDRCVWYLTNMRGHGSQDRVPKVLQILLEYGAHAKRTVPRLKEVAEYFEEREEDFPKNLSIKKGKAVRETIRLLEAMDPKQKADVQLISITRQRP